MCVKLNRFPVRVASKLRVCVGPFQNGESPTNQSNPLLKPLYTILKRPRDLLLGASNCLHGMRRSTWLWDFSEVTAGRPPSFS
jgi:hypothetical protein